MGKVLVTGAGGFIGHHLTNILVQQGNDVRGVDTKAPEFEPSRAREFELLDLRRLDNCLIACRGVDEVYHLAADMGGIGYITHFHADIAKNNTMMNVHMLEASQLTGVKRFLFSSSACIYPQYLQGVPDVTPLKEEKAYPADPEEGYGWEKLYMEKLCQYYTQDYGLETRVVRFHNVYGPLGTYDGGKEKAPAAICRKIALASNGDAIEIWGDGKQTRSFMYIDDCVEGILQIMRGNYGLPLNLGTEEMVTVDQLVDIISKIAKKKIVKRHNSTKPQGVRGRNSDNTLMREVSGWAPTIALQEGLVPTYRWIEQQVGT
jgi:nucleoside-diphosphate-sugar epimerase